MWTQRKMSANELIYKTEIELDGGKQFLWLSEGKREKDQLGGWD